MTLSNANDISGGILNVMKVLLQAGARVNAQDRCGLTALNYCCKFHSENAEAVTLLLSAGADVQTPLWPPYRLQFGAQKQCTWYSTITDVVLWMVIASAVLAEHAYTLLQLMATSKLYNCC